MLALHSRRVRTYSTECASANEVLLQMASQGQLSLLFGVWLDNRPTDQKEIEDLLVYLRKYPNADLYGIAVGNEAVFRGTLQPYEVAAKITEVRNRVRALGQELGSQRLLSVPVFTVEAWPHPELVAASDVVGVNVQPYYHRDLQSTFDPEAMSDMVTQRVFDTLEMIKTLSQGKKVVMAEVGWPTAARPQDQHPGSVGIAKLMMSKFEIQAQAQGVEYFWFELFDSNWKRVMFPSEPDTMPDFHFGLYMADHYTPKGLA